MRIVARNTVRIDLPTWLRSEPYQELQNLDDFPTVITGIPFHEITRGIGRIFCRKLLALQTSRLSGQV